MVETESGSRKTFALILIIVLGAILLYAILPYKNAFFGAMILFVLLKPLYIRLDKNLKKPLAAALSMLTGVLIILIPIGLSAGIIIGQTTSAINSELPTAIENLSEQFPTINIKEMTEDLVGSARELIQRIILSVLGGVTSTVIELTILLFSLYYLLVNHKKIPRFTENIIPFSKKNSKRLTEELATVTNSAVISTGVIAVVQGVLLGVGFAIAGVESAVFWGFIGAVLSFLPVIGAWFVWIPAGIILISQGHVGSGVFVLIWGFVLSNIDNLIRPKLQQRVGKIHPMITLTGVFIGLPLFGILGLIMGPLLLSYFFLMMKMFKEEYL